MKKTDRLSGCQHLFDKLHLRRTHPVKKPNSLLFIGIENILNNNVIYCILVDNLIANEMRPTMIMAGGNGCVNRIKTRIVVDITIYLGDGILSKFNYL